MEEQKAAVSVVEEDTAVEVTGEVSAGALSAREEEDTKAPVTESTEERGADTAEVPYERAFSAALADFKAKRIDESLAKFTALDQRKNAEQPLLLPLPAYNIAACHAALGNYTGAVEWLGSALARQQVRVCTGPHARTRRGLCLCWVCGARHSTRRRRRRRRPTATSQRQLRGKRAAICA